MDVWMDGWMPITLYTLQLWFSSIVISIPCKECVKFLLNKCTTVAIVELYTTLEVQ